MHRIALALAALVLCATAGTALAAEPQHFTSTEHDVFVDDTCSFPILADLVFTNDVTEWDNADGTVDRLQLHQSFVARGAATASR